MIPVHQPEILDADHRSVMAALQRGEISGTGGRDLVEFERRCAATTGVRHGIATTSGTTALQLAVAALGIGPGDEVIVPGLTNIASCLAVVHCGATPVCIDSEPDTWNLDPALLPGLVTNRTRAVMPVHIYGHPVDMDPVLDVARAHGLSIIEDCAESQGALYRGRPTGGIGTIGAFSFYSNKVITTGEGGMLVTDDDALAENARWLRSLAYGRSSRFSHEACGYNFRMTNLQAALGVSQMDRLDSIVERKRRLAAWYMEDLAGAPHLRLPVERTWARNVYWMFSVVLEPGSPVSRDELARRLRERGVETRDFFLPMNLQPAFHKRGLFDNVRLPVAEYLGAAGLYLPSTHTLARETVAEICRHVREIVATPAR